MERRAVNGKKNITPVSASAGLIREYQVASETLILALSKTVYLNQIKFMDKRYHRKIYISKRKYIKAHVMDHQGTEHL